MDASALEAEQASVEEDILKLKLHSVTLNLEWDGQQEEEEEEEEDSFDESFLLSAFEDPDQPSTSGLKPGASTSDFGPSSGPYMDTADSEDDDEPTDVEKEGELIDLSVDLVSSQENLLKLNTVYQQVIQQQLDLIDELLEKNLDKQDQLESDMEDFYSGGNKKQTKLEIDLTRAPFFVNNTFRLREFPATTVVKVPPHPDVNRRRHELGEHFIEQSGKQQITAVKWRKYEKKKLKSGVHRVALQHIITPLMSQLDYLKEKTKFSNGGDPEMEKKIEVVRSKIDTAEATETSALFGDRNMQHDWAAISTTDLEGLRTPIQCALCWQNNLHPSINKKQWTATEDAKLKQVVRKYREKDWKNIAIELATNRTPLQCIQRYQRTNRQHLEKLWTPDEDARLMRLVGKYGTGNIIPWTLIAMKMSTPTTGIQVEQRWKCNMDRNAERRKWTVEEDVKLTQAVAKYGCRWAAIRKSGMIPGRNKEQCRERWVSSLCSINHDPWTKEEDQMLMELVPKNGRVQWERIAQAFDRRTEFQLSRRWTFINIRREKGKKIKYKEKGPRTIADGLQEIRQKLFDAIKKQMADKKKGLVGLVPENPPIAWTAPAEEIKEDDQDSRDDNQQVASLSTRQVIPPHPNTANCQRIGTEHEQRIKTAQKIEEIIEVYKDICIEVNSQKEQPRVVKGPPTTDAIRVIRERMYKVITSKYRPFKHAAITERTNIHENRRKVLLTLEKITPEIIFIHYMKAMNINAEKTLQAIMKGKEPENAELQTASAESPARTAKRKRSTSAVESAQVENASVETGSQSFVRNNMMHLCAPNRATLSAYRRLMQDRQRRLKTAKLMLLEKNTKSKGKKAAINPGGESEESVNGHSNSYEGKKYCPEVLMQNIQLMPEHKNLRTRFVSLFTWPTILSTLVPYERVGNSRKLKPAVKIKKINNERKEDDSEGVIPCKRRRQLY